MICLDTTFLIDFLKERIIITEEINNSLKNTAAITPFSIFELYHGIYRLKRKEPDFDFDKREREILNFIKIFQIINYNDKAAIKTAEVLDFLESEGKIIDLVDIMIASAALVNDFKTIITRNESHFNKIPGISVIGYEIRKRRKKETAN